MAAITRDIDAAVRDPDLDAHDAGIGRHAPIGRRRSRGIRLGQTRIPAGDQARHERAVSVGVHVPEGVGLRLQRQVRAVNDLARVASPSTGLTPVSMTATSTPFPVYPACHQAAAPVQLVVLDME